MSIDPASFVLATSALCNRPKMAYSHGKVTVRQRLEGLYDVAASSFADVESALGLVDEDSEDSDIDF